MATVVYDNLNAVSDGNLGISPALFDSFKPTLTGHLSSLKVSLFPPEVGKPDVITSVDLFDDLNADPGNLIANLGEIHSLPFHLQAL